MNQYPQGGPQQHHPQQGHYPSHHGYGPQYNGGSYGAPPPQEPKGSSTARIIAGVIVGCAVLGILVFALVLVAAFNRRGSQRECFGSECGGYPPSTPASPPRNDPGVLVPDPQPQAAPQPQQPSRPKTTTKQGNAFRVSCPDGSPVLVGGGCLCGGTDPIANPCPGKASIRTDGDACVFTCETTRQTCAVCGDDCLTKADAAKASDPSWATHLASQYCRADCSPGTAMLMRCHGYGLLLQ